MGSNEAIAENISARQKRNSKLRPSTRKGYYVSLFLSISNRGFDRIGRGSPKGLTSAFRLSNRRVGKNPIHKSVDSALRVKMRICPATDCKSHEAEIRVSGDSAQVLIDSEAAAPCAAVPHAHLPHVDHST